MKIFCLTTVAAMMLLSAGALWISATREFHTAELIATNTTLRCGAGYYNEGFVFVAVATAVAAFVLALISLDYLKAKS